MGRQWKKIRQEISVRPKVGPSEGDRVAWPSVGKSRVGKREQASQTGKDSSQDGQRWQVVRGRKAEAVREDRTKPVECENRFGLLEGEGESESESE